MKDIYESLFVAVITVVLFVINWKMVKNSTKKSESGLLRKR